MASQEQDSSNSLTSTSKDGGMVSPRGQCLCSPTTHQGSFRCRFHRSVFTQSKSMPEPATPAAPSFSPKSPQFK